jgi:hypothetical protein
MSGDIAAFYIPFTAKGDDSERVVEGYVSSPAVDCDEQIVDQEWLKSELPEWMLRYGNIREQHNPQRAVGRAQAVDVQTQPGPYLSARIVDDDAWRKVQAGVYNGFSVGIKAPRIVHDGTAKNGRIVGGKLIEISIVDRPANEAAKFVVLKRAGERAWKLGEEGPVVEEQGMTDQEQPADRAEAGNAASVLGTAASTGGADGSATQEPEGSGQAVTGAPPLALSFATEADLTKFVTRCVDALLAGHRPDAGATEFVTKAALAEPLAAIPEIAKLASGIARGLEALADRTKATADALVATKAAVAGSQADVARLGAAVAETQADLARVKELAQPVKGTVFAIEKGIGSEPDRIYRDGVVPESAKRGAEAAKMLAGLSDEERRQVSAAVLSERYRARQ